MNGPDVMHACLPHVYHMTRVFDFRCRDSNLDKEGSLSIGYFQVLLDEDMERY